MGLNSKFLSDVSFVELVFIIIISWIQIALWQRTLDNFTFNTLRLRRDSTLHAMIIALVVTTISLAFIFIFDSIFGGLLEQEVENAISPPLPLIVGGLR